MPFYFKPLTDSFARREYLNLLLSNRRNSSSFPQRIFLNYKIKLKGRYLTGEDIQTGNPSTAAIKDVILHGDWYRTNFCRSSKYIVWIFVLVVFVLCGVSYVKEGLKTCCWNAAYCRVVLAWVWRDGRRALPSLCMELTSRASVQWSCDLQVLLQIDPLNSGSLIQSRLCVCHGPCWQIFFFFFYICFMFMAASIGLIVSQHTGV